MQRPTCILLLALSGGALPAVAQSIGPAALTAAGGSSVTAGVSHEFAIGQVVGAASYSSGALLVTPGVLQPLITPAGVRAAALAPDDLHVYPSPASTVLYLQPGFKGAGRLSFSLYDGAGRLVLQQEAALSSGTELQQVPVAALAAGQYNLQVSWLQGGQIAASAYKIQKLQ